MNIDKPQKPKNCKFKDKTQEFQSIIKKGSTFIWENWVNEMCVYKGITK